MGCHPVAAVIMHVHKYEIKITQIWSKDIGRLQGLTAASNWSVPSTPNTVEASSSKT